ncbi:hypothetical protein LOK49_LG08G02966 [Camellia lanceoleosa]|uniref:Uncharacterized protein n=1 Tax=Camellia lanceoleosa TaxID=1840588 RepID=A0ACC0GTK6_9ERIC|nr:hypothetical protein LOK49_LG08G02966 [Camellia lanceoleosa]
MDSYGVRKKVRTPTFNQLTALTMNRLLGYLHIERVCPGLYYSRATSKVVAVAHSISKDMKFDLASTRNATACAAVGEVLAQRALADDIHNAVYTPRKGEKLEGKLQIVLQAIIDNGVNVKVKIKQKKRKHGNQLLLRAIVIIQFVCLIRSKNLLHFHISFEIMVLIVSIQAIYLK